MPNKFPFILAFSWTVIITLLSLISLGDVGNTLKIPYKDKVVHFVFYFFFVLLWFKVVQTPQSDRRTGLFLFLAGVFYGLLMEAFQSLFTTTRTADILDALANTLGAFAGQLWIRHRFLNKKQI